MDEYKEKRSINPFITNTWISYIIGYLFIFIIFMLTIWIALYDHSQFGIGVGIICVIVWAIIFYKHAKQKLENHRVKFALLSQDAMMPEKNDEDAGYDIYATFDDNWMIIKSHKTVMVPTGIKSAFNKRYVAVLKERGSTGTRGIGQRSGIIDSGYRGEWFVPITNHNNYDIAIVKEDWMDEFMVQFDVDSMEIYPYEKAIAQALFLPVPELIIEQISQDEYSTIDSKRGDGALGSSGK